MTEDKLLYLNNMKKLSIFPTKLCICLKDIIQLFCGSQRLSFLEADVISKCYFL